MTITLSTTYQPRLIGAIAAAHARYYAENWDFGVYFEAKVARDCAAFMERASSEDLVLSAWEGDRFAGSLIVDAHDPHAPTGWAHLRWFIVTSPGHGLGGLMMDRAMAFLDDRALPCFLDTFAGLGAARALYEKAGFTLVRESAAETWGTVVNEQRFERAVSGKLSN